jgi:hypothetical protein
MMRIYRRNLHYLVVTLFAAFIFAACENPFDPLATGDEIRGLTYFDFGVEWDRWDTDPEYDGVTITLEYFNEFGDSLSFHSKPHDVVIEFYTEKPAYMITNPENPAAEPTPGPLTADSLFFSYPATFESSEDNIRIPIEAYRGALEGAGYDLKDPDGAKAFVQVRVYPPKAHPLPELNAWQSGVEVYSPEEVIGPDVVEEVQ